MGPGGTTGRVVAGACSQQKGGAKKRSKEGELSKVRVEERRGIVVISQTRKNGNRWETPMGNKPRPRKERKKRYGSPLLRENFGGFPARGKARFRFPDRPVGGLTGIVIGLRKNALEKGLASR